MYATLGTIGGWTITNHSFQSTSGSKTTGLQIPSSGTWAIAVGSPSVDSWSNAPFRVNHSGSLYATAANITGTITASGGKIDAWTIGNGGMYYVNGSSGCGLVGDSRHANIAFYAGANTTNIGGAPFRVYHDGSLYASNANITGTISVGSVLGNSSNGFSITRETVSSYTDSWFKASYDGYTTRIGAKGVLLGSPGGDTPNYSHRDWFTILSVSPGSDIRMKKDIVYLSDEDNLENFYTFLKPCSFYYNEKAGDDTEIGKIHFGYIAQDVKQELETYGIKNSAMVRQRMMPDKYYTLLKDEFIALNTWQIQKLKNRIKELEKKLTAMNITQ